MLVISTNETAVVYKTTVTASGKDLFGFLVSTELYVFK